jgi:hypothetical protein
MSTFLQVVIMTFASAINRIVAGEGILPGLRSTAGNEEEEMVS